MVPTNFSKARMSLNPAYRGPAQIEALTSIRFIFAMMVVVGHFLARVDLGPYPGFVYGMPPVAVSWFFILSGYIISYNYPTLPTWGARSRFLVLRVARLWPVHVVILTAGILIGLYPANHPWLRFQYALIQSWTLSSDIAMSYNGPAWSVSVELFFYVLYAAISVANRQISAIIVASFIGIGLWISIYHGCYGDATDPSCNYWIFVFPPNRLIEFVAGALIFRAKLRVPQTLGLLMAGLPFYMNLSRGWWQAAVIIGGCALIASLSRSGWLSRFLSVGALVLGGEISYSMYMSHEFINGIIFIVSPGLRPWLLFTLTTSITLVVSTLLFFVVESPSRNFVKWLLKRRAVRSAQCTSQIETAESSPQLQQWSDRHEMIH